MTTPVPAEDSTFTNLSTPDPNTKIGPVTFQVNGRWKQELASRSGIVNRLQAVGKEMEGEMAGLVPHGPSGHLADSIYSRVVRSRGAKGQFGGAELQVGDSADYALPVEFGHHVANSEEFVEPRPFIRPVVLKKRNLK